MTYIFGGAAIKHKGLWLLSYLLYYVTLYYYYL